VHPALATFDASIIALERFLRAHSKPNPSTRRSDTESATAELPLPRATALLVTTLGSRCKKALEALVTDLQAVS
jgi:hypothetical protein